MFHESVNLYSKHVIKGARQWQVLICFTCYLDHNMFQNVYYELVITFCMYFLNQRGGLLSERSSTQPFDLELPLAFSKLSLFAPCFCDFQSLPIIVSLAATARSESSVTVEETLLFSVNSFSTRNVILWPLRARLRANWNIQKWIFILVRNLK